MDKEYAITKEICLLIGGHCYKEVTIILGDWEQELSEPPDYARVCIHCGHRQIGYKEAPIRWKDKIKSSHWKITLT